MLWTYKNIAFGSWEHCFWKLRAMLLEAGSYAFRGWEHCFWRLGAMLLEAENYAFGSWEHVFRQLKGIFHKNSLMQYDCS